MDAFGGPEVLGIRDIPEPPVGPEEIRIRVVATALNRADLAEREGRYPPPGKPPVYQVPGLEAAGVVESVGERVTSFQPGDRVMALLPGGGYAEYVAVHERLAMPVPSDLPLAEAARAFGAEETVNYHQETYLDRVKSWSDGNGVDVILDFIGKDYLHDNLHALAAEGTLVLIGALSGYEAPINLGLVQARRLKIHGTALRSRPLEKKMALVQQFVDEALWLFETGRVKPVIDRAFPLESIQEAHRYMESNQNIGKILVTVGQEG
nr:zinc-binding dehydrogenase [Sulfobacillus harzensis]